MFPEHFTHLIGIKTCISFQPFCGPKIPFRIIQSREDLSLSLISYEFSPILQGYAPINSCFRNLSIRCRLGSIRNSHLFLNLASARPSGNMQTFAYNFQSCPTFRERLRKRLYHRLHCTVKYLLRGCLDCQYLLAPEKVAFQTPTRHPRSV
jgi:hypothetical protein